MKDALSENDRDLDEFDLPRQDARLAQSLGSRQTSKASEFWTKTSTTTNLLKHYISTRHYSCGPCNLGLEENLQGTIAKPHTLSKP